MSAFGGKADIDESTVPIKLSLTECDPPVYSVKGSRLLRLKNGPNNGKIRLAVLESRSPTLTKLDATCRSNGVIQMARGIARWSLITVTLLLIAPVDLAQTEPTTTQPVPSKIDRCKSDLKCRFLAQSGHHGPILSGVKQTFS